MEFRKRGLWLAVVATVGCVALSVGATCVQAARPRFHLFARTDGGSFGAALSDGVRYVVLPFGLSSRVRVVDTVRGAAFEEPAPTAIGYDSPTPAACVPRGVGDGRLLWGCPSQTATPNVVIQNLWTRAFIRPAGLDMLGSSSRWTDFYAIGRYWLVGFATYPAGGGQVFLNWRTGEARNPLSFVSHFGDHHIEDENWSTLERPLCRPLKRPRFSFDDSGGRTYYAYASYVSDGSWAAYTRPSDGELRLARCGQRRTAVLGNSPEDLLLTSGWLTYRFSDRIEALRLADRRLYEWGTEEGGLPYGIPHLTHTANRLLASFCTTRYEPYRQECAVYSATLPPLRPAPRR